MNTNVHYPKVLLVGRTNVGKSTLFNRLADNKHSIVFDREGVTRDYIQEVITWDEKTFDLVDTGGLSFKKSNDSIGKSVQEKVLTLLSQAALVVFVCDGKDGVVEQDRQIARLLHKTAKHVLLVINKVDNSQMLEDSEFEFSALGFDTWIKVSAVHGSGIGQLLTTMAKYVGQATVSEEEKLAYRVVLVGKPNVGKSSLMNLLAKKDRSIVSDIAGTTREPITENVYCCNELVEFSDTAGVRRKSRVEDDLESLMVKSTLDAVKQADIVIAMFDASEGKLNDQELKLLFYALEQRKMVLVVFNKTDLLDEYKRTLLEQHMDEYEFILKKLPVVRVSCLTKKNVDKIFGELQAVWQRCQQPFKTTEVDDIVKQALEEKPLFHIGIKLRVFKIRHVKAQIPTFVLHVNFPEWFGPSQLSCIENILRKHYDLKGCPIQFSVKKV